MNLKVFTLGFYVSTNWIFCGEKSRQRDPIPIIQQLCNLNCHYEIYYNNIMNIFLRHSILYRQGAIKRPQSLVNKFYILVGSTLPKY